MSATTSATVTIALSIYTPDGFIVTVTSVPNNVVTTCPLDSIPDITLSPTTWCSNIFVNNGTSFNNPSTVPEPSALNAASVGANNVNGPGPERVPPNPHVSTAISNKLWSADVTTTSYTVLVA